MSVAVATAWHRPQDGHVLEAYLDYVASCGSSASATEWRETHARQFLGRHPDLQAWMQRPLDARCADLDRTKAWPLLTWAILTRAVVADLDLLLGRRLGGMHSAAEAMFADEYATMRQAADRLGWNRRWVERVVAEPLTLAVAWSGRSPRAISDDDLDALAGAIGESPVLSAARRVRLRRDVGRLRRILYEAGTITRPHRATRPAHGLAGYLAGTEAAEVRRVMLAYLEARRPVLRPGSLEVVANSLGVFGSFLAEHHPEVRSLGDLDRRHVESYCQWVPTRARRRADNGHPISAAAVHHDVVTLRTFLEDITCWGWAEAPARQLLFATDIPRLPKALPRALVPNVDAAVMAAVARLGEPVARIGLTVIRGTGLRIGELLDLELDCVVDYGSSGSWLRVPLGKLATERSVPLDDATLGVLDEWIALRGPQHPLPHPRDGRLVDFLFVEHGQRPPASRLRLGLARAVADAGVRGPGGGPLRVTPHQLRHTYATDLANAGMSLQALMALLGHASPDMTLRYAAVASPTIRAAYDAAIGKLRRRIPVAPAGRPATPETVDWLRSEMLKTRVAHGHCSRDLAAGACPYANICEQCENFVTTPAFGPQIETQLADVSSLRDDAADRGWDDEAARHQRVIDSLQRHLNWLPATSEP